MLWGTPYEMGPTRPYLSHPIFPSTDRGNKQSAGNKHALLTCASQNKAAPIDRKDIAHALHQRNVLRVTESIQISPNGRFCSIKFTTPQLMQTFCTEGLTISENNTVYFKPDFKPRQNRTYSFISFLNVPLETKEKEMDAYVKQFCTVRGVHYPFQKMTILNTIMAQECTEFQILWNTFPKQTISLGGGSESFTTTTRPEKISPTRHRRNSI